MNGKASQMTNCNRYLTVSTTSDTLKPIAFKYVVGLTREGAEKVLQDRLENQALKLKLAICEQQSVNSAIEVVKKDKTISDNEKTILKKDKAILKLIISNIVTVALFLVIK